MTTDSTAGRKVTVTFDNGPTPGITDGVLDVLAERGIRATFFVVGSKLRQPRGRDLARRAVAEGHRVGHHTMTHTVLLGAAKDAEAAIKSEIADLAPELEEFDAGEKLYRPYAAGGVLDQQVFSRAALRYLAANGYTCVLWNSVPHDWDDPVGWVERALDDVSKQTWTVVVLHDVDTGAMAHLPRFLDELSARGVEIVPEFPDSCLPIRAGQTTETLSRLTMETAP
ncbi:MAG TPA: polysaccharide deacetylase family protein [Acidimicrobiales bacterium]|nr:polysaccharide deacetylase family protein [Acidimicrobiales bacterium]